MQFLRRKSLAENKELDLSTIPHLISFPRTGSHWFRMLLELYSDRPLLTRSFFKHKKKDYLLFHTHDMNLSESRKSIIYLYRYPTDVIYSQLNYYKQPINDEIFIRFWAHQYSIHLIHWLFLEQVSEQKTIISYEQMKSDIAAVFKNVCGHLVLDYDEDKIRAVVLQVDKQKVAKQTTHDPQVINKKEDYQSQKLYFTEKYDDLIMKIMRVSSEHLLGDQNMLLSKFQ